MSSGGGKRPKNKFDDTLCASCSVIRFMTCPWATRGKPVKNWTADITVLMVGNRKTSSFTVKKCPRYVAGNGHGQSDMHSISADAANKLATAVFKQTFKDYKNAKQKYFNLNNVDFLLWCDIAGVDPDNFIKTMMRR